MTASSVFSRRSFGSVSTQSLGKPAARFPAAVATDSDLAIAVDRQQTALALPCDSVSSSMTVTDASKISAYNLLSIDNEIVKVTAPPSGNLVPIQRGFDGTAPALHLSGATVSGFIDAWHHNALVAEIEAIQQALGANLSNIPASSQLIASGYNWSQAPGGSLAVGANVIQLSTPYPKGLAVGSPVYVTGGTGAAEAAPITGWNASTGQLIINCANAHTGAWSVGSASGGIQEALQVAAGTGGGQIFIPAGTVAQTTVNIPTSGIYTLVGSGKYIQAIARGSGFGTGPILRCTAGILELDNLGLVSGPGLGSASPAILIDGGSIVVNNVSIGNGYVGIQLKNWGSAVVQGLDCGQYDLSFMPLAGLWVGGESTSQPSSNLLLSDSIFTSAPQTSANQGIAGILIDQVDGMIADNCWCVAQVGIMIRGTNASGYITNVEITNSFIDACKQVAVSFETSGVGATNTIKFTSGHFHGQKFGTTQGQNSSVFIAPGSNVEYLEFIGCHMRGSKLHGVNLLRTGAKSILFSGCIFSENDQTGMVIADGVTGLTVTGCRASDNTFYGIQCLGAIANSCIADNNLVGNGLGPLLIGGAVTASVVANNNGVENTVPVLTSAASVALLANSTYTVTGTVPIATVTGGWIGRTVTFLFTNAAPGGIAAGGNIYIAKTAAQNATVSLRFDGTKWMVL